MQFVLVEFIPTQLCIQSEQLINTQNPTGERSKKNESSHKYWPQRELMYVIERATAALTIGTFKLRLVFKVWNGHIWLHGGIPTSLAVWSISLVLWSYFPFRALNSGLWCSWENKSGFNNIEGFRDINENVTSVDGLGAAPLTSLEPPGLPSWWCCVMLDCWVGWNHDSVLIESWAQSQGPVTLAKKT